MLVYVVAKLILGSAAAQCVQSGKKCISHGSKYCQLYAIAAQKIYHDTDFLTVSIHSPLDIGFWADSLLTFSIRSLHLAWCQRAACTGGMVSFSSYLESNMPSNASSDTCSYTGHVIQQTSPLSLGRRRRLLADVCWVWWKHKRQWTHPRFVMNL